MKQHLLIESIGNVVDILSEGIETKNLYMQGIFAQADVLNQNGRNYPFNEMNNAVMDFTDRIKKFGGIFGEGDHPQNLTINLDRISHVITELRMDGNNAIGKAKILKETPLGNILHTLVNTGVKIGMSTRGAGNIGPNGIISDFKLITVDAVISPSAPGALPNSVYESLDMDKNGKNVLSLSEALQHDKKAQKYFAAEIQKFIRNVMNK